jgi:quercetin dioxygenase-like cupin family protein
VSKEPKGSKAAKPAKAATVRMRNRTLPGKYTVGCWQTLTAPDPQAILQEEVIATQRVMVVRCVYKPDSEFPPHVHRREQLTIVEAGTLEFTVNGGAVQVGPGQMISVHPGVLHGTRVQGGQPVRTLNIFHASDEPHPGAMPTLATLSRLI